MTEKNHLKEIQKQNQADNKTVQELARQAIESGVVEISTKYEKHGKFSMQVSQKASEKLQDRGVKGKIGSIFSGIAKFVTGKKTQKELPKKTQPKNTETKSITNQSIERRKYLDGYESEMKKFNSPEGFYGKVQSFIEYLNDSSERDGLVAKINKYSKLSNLEDVPTSVLPIGNEATPRNINVQFNREMAKLPNISEKKEMAKMDYTTRLEAFNNNRSFLSQKVLELRSKLSRFDTKKELELSKIINTSDRFLNNDYRDQDINIYSSQKAIFESQILSLLLQNGFEVTVKGSKKKLVYNPNQEASVTASKESQSFIKKELATFSPDQIDKLISDEWVGALAEISKNYFNLDLTNQPTNSPEVQEKLNFIQNQWPKISQLGVRLVQGENGQYSIGEHKELQKPEVAESPKDIPAEKENNNPNSTESKEKFYSQERISNRLSKYGIDGTSQLKLDDYLASSQLGPLALISEDYFNIDLSAEGKDSIAVKNRIRFENEYWPKIKEKGLKVIQTSDGLYKVSEDFEIKNEKKAETKYIKPWVGVKSLLKYTETINNKVDAQLESIEDISLEDVQEFSQFSNEMANLDLSNSKLEKSLLFNKVIFFNQIVPKLQRLGFRFDQDTDSSGNTIVSFK